MSTFRTILVAADLSADSKDAFRVACSLARAGETQLVVLNVLEPEYVSEGPVFHNQRSVVFVPVARTAGELEVAAGGLREDYVPISPLVAEFVVREGKPADEILRLAEEIACDLIVLGTHGRTGLRRLLAGSVAEAVLRQAPCPVMALHGPGIPRRRDEPGVILHPTDFSDCSGAALQVARQLAVANGSRLVVMHAVPRTVYLLGAVPEPRDLGVVRDSLAALASGADGPDLKNPVEYRLVEGETASEITRLADEISADLIVVGTHGRGGVGRLLMGSVTESVLRKGGRPVLAVKAPHASTLKPSHGPAPGIAAV